MFYDRRQRKPSPAACIGGLFAAAGIALAAYATHAKLTPMSQQQLHTAALFLFGNGVGLAAIATGTTRLVGKLALFALVLGTLFFSGSLALNAVNGTGTALAPVGGSLMIAGWVLWAIDAVRS